MDKVWAGDWAQLIPEIDVHNPEHVDKYGIAVTNSDDTVLLLMPDGGIKAFPVAILYAPIGELAAIISEVLPGVRVVRG